VAYLATRARCRGQSVNQIVAVAALKRCGCSVDVVSNGLQALEALSAGHYDAVLMDCQMPELDGYEATRSFVASSMATIARP